MKKIECLNIVNEKKQITLKLSNKDFLEFNYFIIKERKSKEEYKIYGIRNADENLVSLPYSCLEFKENKFLRLDLYIMTNDGKLKRPKINNERVDFKKIKYSQFYFLNNNHGVEFYITKDKEISLLYGNFFKVKKEFYPTKSFEIRVKEVQDHDGLVQIKISFSSNIKYSGLIWKSNKKSDFIEKVSYEYEENYCTITILEDVLYRRNDLENGKMVLTYIKEDILYEGTLVFDQVTMENQLENNQKIYFIEDNNKFYFTANLNLYLEKKYTTKKQRLFVDKYKLINDHIQFYLNNAKLSEKIFIFREDIINKKFFKVLDFQIFNNVVSIPIDLEALRSKQSIDRRYRYILVTEDKEIINPKNQILVKYFGFYWSDYIKKGLKKEKYKLEKVFEDEKLLLSYWSEQGELILKITTKEDYNRLRYESRKIDININNLQISNSKILFQIENLNFSENSNIEFFIRERKKKKSDILIPFIHNKDFFELDFTNISSDMGRDVSRWDTFIKVQGDDTIIEGKIGKFSSSVESKFNRYFSSLNEQENKHNFALVPYLTVKNELSLIYNDDLRIKNERLEYNIKILSNRIKKDIIEIDAEISDLDLKDYSIKEGVMKLRNKALDISYSIPIEVIRKNKNGFLVRICISPEKYKLMPYFWDLYIVIETSDEKFWLRLKNPSIKLKDNISKKISRSEINLNNSFVIYPYITEDNSYALCFREKKSYENRFNRFKENLSYLIYRLFKKHFDKKNIWISYEKEASVAQDNGYQFFNYCYQNNKKKEFYFIIKTDSADYQDIKSQNDKILKFMSFKYMMYMYAAKLLISSESKGHSYDIRIQKGHLRNSLKNKKFVFLQHGVTALKRVDYVFKKKKNNSVSLFTATSDYEKNIIKKYFGYDDSEIMVTGFTRWDVLTDKSNNAERKIFVMPTWRSWMDGILEEEFETSLYYKQYTSLLQSKEINELLFENNITLHFLLHPKFKEYSKKFDTGGEQIKTHQFGDIKINEMLMESSLLITDYSSVAWEFYYMKKPTIFFQFDKEQYKEYQGSYLDLDNELFGDQVLDISELKNRIKYYIENNFKEKDEFKLMRNKYFKYVDQNNSKRTFEEIKKFEKKK